jgi:DNA-binding response OmpR family regulator
MRILIVEDEIEIAKNLTSMLKQRGNSIIHASDGETALKVLNEQSIDIVILDIRLPGMSGEEVLRDFRKNDGRYPVIVLTGHIIEEEDHIRLLQLGADDYLTKPYSDDVLWERIKAVRRRYDGYTTNIVMLPGDISINLDNKSVKLNNSYINLTKTEYAIFELLVRKRGEWVSYDDFFKSIWNNPEWGGPTIINTHIKNLRKKLGSELIKTKRGFGFQITLVPSENKT